MKKTFAVILAVLFVMSFAASAFAIHAEIPAETTATVAAGGTQLTFGGQIRVRGLQHWGRSAGDMPWEDGTSSIADEDVAYLEQRVRLSVKAQVTPNVLGFIHLESDTGSGTGDNYKWGNFSKKPVSSFQFLEAWIQYTGSGLFGFPTGLKVGHMPLALGENIFFDHRQYGDDAIVLFMDPNKQLHIGLLYIKFAEGSNTTVGNESDLTGYVGLMTYKINDNHMIGANYTFLNQPELAGADVDYELHNIGLHAKGKAGAFGYAAEADFQFGSMGAGAAESDFQGWAAILDANYRMGSANLRGRLQYMTGNDDGVVSGDTEQFQSFVTGGVTRTFLYGDKITTIAGSNSHANTMQYNLGIDYDATKDLSFSLDGTYIVANEVPSGIDEVLGTEIDGVMKYKLAKNLTLITQLSHFIAGDYYADTGALVGLDKSDVTVLRQTFVLDF